MKCRHENADHLKPGDVLTPSGYAPIEEGQPVLVEQFRCLDCGEWLSLGPASLTSHAEMECARLLADMFSGDWTIDGCDISDLEDATVELAAELEWRAEQLRTRPRSPIEMMVDQACGITREQ